MTNEEAIKTLEANYPDACFEQLREAVDAAIEALKAQDADSDTISRKAAIDAILAVTGNSSVRELYEHVQEHGLSDMWSGGVNAAIDIIIAVPSAQPDSKEMSSTHKVLDTISRQAALNALSRGSGCGASCHRAIKALPPAQPDMSEYSDKLWRNAYERGRAEAQPRWIPCSERLPKKERRTYWVCTDAETQHECRWTNNRFGMTVSDEWGWNVFDTPQYTKVIAWMPLPEPYAERRNE